MSPSRGLRLTPAGIAASIAVAIVAIVCLRLGFWQLDRLEQRRQMNVSHAERMSLPAVDLEQAPSDTSGLLLRTVHLRGTFDHAHTIVRGGRSRAGSPGVHLLTPLRLEETAEPILVNRGWLPSPDGASVDLARFRQPGLQEITGMVMPLGANVDDDDAASGEAVGATSGFRRVWFRLEAEPLLAQFPYPMPPIYVQALPDGGTAGERVGGRSGATEPPRATTPTGETQRGAIPEQPIPIARPELDDGPHLGYAIQWFSFAAIAVIGWLVLVAREEGRNGGGAGSSSGRSVDERPSDKRSGSEGVPGG